MFTGIAKEKFLEYFHQTNLDHCNSIEKIISGQTQAYYAFMNLNESMQWGVIQDFGDSLGYNVLVSYNPEDKCFMWLISKNEKDDILFDETLDCDTRHEARTAAIQKLNELINK